MTRTISAIVGADALADWHADDISGVGDGGSVTSWVDRVNSITLTNPGTAPLWVANYAASGYAAVDFGAITPLTCESAILNTSIWTCLFVWASAGTGTAPTLYCPHDGTNWVRVRLESGNIYIQDSGGIGLLASNSDADESVRGAAGAVYGSGVSRIWVADAASSQGRPGLVTSTSAGTTVQDGTIFIGSRAGTLQPWIGKLHQLMIFPGGLDDRKIIEALTQLRYNWGISDVDSEPVAVAGGSTTHNPFRSRAFGG
jgi:hypothetical protein